MHRLAANILVYCLLCFSSSCFGQTTGTDKQYKVIKVVDGDTLDILVDGRFSVRLRLNGIDCPETGQPFGRNAKAFVSQFTKAAGGHVQVKVTGMDKYRRHLADVYSDGKQLNATLVANGLAWHYKRFSSDAALAEAEDNARAAKLGLWADPRHVAPWAWRDLSKLDRDRLR